MDVARFTELATRHAEDVPVCQHAGTSGRCQTAALVAFTSDEHADLIAACRPWITRGAIAVAERMAVCATRKAPSRVLTDILNEIEGAEEDLQMADTETGRDIVRTRLIRIAAIALVTINAIDERRQS